MPRDTLRHAALAQQREGAARGSDGKQALWQSLLAGRWSVVDAFSAKGMRYVIAHRNADDDVVHRALSERERSVVELVRAGRSGKWIAIELRLSESTVARTLRLALHKIGVTDTTALIGMKNALFDPLEGLAARADLAVARLDPVERFPPLSDAERAIVTGILGGKRVAAIARERGTSPRTVSNQIANVYRKLGVSSRREVLALLT